MEQELLWMLEVTETFPPLAQSQNLSVPRVRFKPVSELRFDQLWF